SLVFSPKTLEVRENDCLSRRESLSMQIHQCRVCQSNKLELILDLGRTALANRFLKPEALMEPEPFFPLRVVLCGDCGLVQLDEEVPREILFKDYIYA